MGDKAGSCGFGFWVRLPSIDFLLQMLKGSLFSYGVEHWKLVKREHREGSKTA